MTRAVLLLSAVILWPAPAAPETPGVTGWASAYADGVMDEVIRVRFTNDWWPTTPPRGWYESHGAIAVMDCRRVGQMATVLSPTGREYRVLIADCAGPGDPDRFSRDNIIVELDYALFTRLTERHGRPLEVTVK